MPSSAELIFFSFSLFSINNTIKEKNTHKTTVKGGNTAYNNKISKINQKKSITYMLRLLRILIFFYSYNTILLKKEMLLTALTLLTILLLRG